MMEITLAQALKEKNRIVGEVGRLWTLVEEENSCWEFHSRSIDVKDTMKTIEYLIEKLVELKTKIGHANKGNLENMYALEECKSQMSRFSKLNTEEDVRYRGANDDIMDVRSAEITAQEVQRRSKELQLKCNQLQDALDAYNAAHKIEFDSPLK